jgi:hypothetical protein
MKTAQAVAFFALLRMGEFTSTAKEFAEELNLSRGYVKFETENGVSRATITINNGRQISGGQVSQLQSKQTVRPLYSQ